MSMHVSVDGFVATRDGGLDWAYPRFDDELNTLSAAALAEFDTILLGGVNYREQASHWPSAEGELAEIMNTVEKVVFSKTLGEDEVKWRNARLAKGKPASQIRRLRDRPGDGKIAVAGGATLVRSLTEEGLIDEYRLLIHPVALGEGLSIFSRPVKLELIHSRPLRSGVVVNGYRRVG